jgi:hypothetical protein
MSARISAEQLTALRQFSAGQAAATDLGRRWRRLLGDHAGELLQLYATRPRVQETVERALAELAELVKSRESEQPRVIDDEVTAAVNAALGALDEVSSPAVHSLTNDARKDLQTARGRNLHEILTEGCP